MRPFTIFDAEHVVEMTVRHNPALQSTDDSKRFCAAVMAIRQLISPEWVRTHIVGGKDASDWLRSGAMFLPESIAKMERGRFVIRVLRLADMLLNFQMIDGFDNLVERIKTADVEATVANFEAAEMLYRSDVPFVFVKEQLRTGSDYDLLATIGETRVACEVKCRLEGTDLGENTFKNALKKSQSQLPADMAGIVFLKIPESWAPKPETLTSFRSALNEAFASTGRVSAVIVFFEEWIDLAQTGIHSFYRQMTEHNPNARTPINESGRIIKSPLNQQNWMSITNLFGNAQLPTRKPLSIRIGDLI